VEQFKVLIVDDEMIVRNSLQRIISVYGHETFLAENGEEAIQKMLAVRPDLIFLDYRLPDLNGLEVLKRIKKEQEEVLVVVFSAYGTFRTVVEAMKLGAFDYLQKPYQNEEVAVILMKANETLKLKREVRELRARSKSVYRSDEIVAQSSQMRKLLDLAVMVGKSGDTPTLIEGETGVGKEVIAQVVHNNSRRCEGPFITVNCGAFPKGLMESELFGYEKGAFTGALDSGKAGFLELAERGTLFLDEVAELADGEQVKLLRILEGKGYFKVGGVKERRANVRIISATNRSLEREVEARRFREDLYYRLNVVRIKIPPLRERKSDIVPLAKHFIEVFNKKFNKKIKAITPQARKALLTYEWKGNVRELRNVIERTVMLTKGGVIDSDSFILNSGHISNTEQLVINLSAKGINLDEVNKLLIEKAMILSNDNALKAAKLLGLRRGALRYRIRKYNILVPLSEENAG